MTTAIRNVTAGATVTAAALLAYYFLSGNGEVVVFIEESSPILLILICLYIYLLQGSGDDEPVLSHDDTVEVMAKILDGLRTIAVQHVRAAENIKEQLVQQGQDMGREEIMTSIILPHFKNAFAGLQKQVLEVIAIKT